MKKIILGALLWASGFSLFGQNNNSVPDNIRINFENTYQGAKDVTWESVKLPVFGKYETGYPTRYATGEPAMDGWRASYITNNRLMYVYYPSPVYVYYTSPGKSYTVALPAIENYVPEDVITKAISQNGKNIVDITEMKNAMNSVVYHVRLTENGNNITSVWINADGSAASDIYVTR